MVIKSLTVTEPVKVADVQFVMVRLLMLTDVPLIAPAVRLKSKAPLSVLLKRISLPPELRVVIAVRVTAWLKV